jgi:hypothetical protein
MDDPEFPEVYFSMLLNKDYGFWRRLRKSFTYVTGIGEYPPEYGSVLLNAAKIDELIGALKKAKEKTYG